MMKDPDTKDPWFGPGPVLRESWADHWGEFLAAVRHIGEVEAATQLESVMVPLQTMNGSEREFSFMAYPIPRLTREQREEMELRDSRSVSVKVLNGRIRIDLDDFGQINWFYVFDLPELYHKLERSIAVLRTQA
jgi:hypothetical protein